MAKVLIGIPTAEYARRAEFYDFVDMMDKPDNTVCSKAHGQSPARNRNLIIKQALEHECTHIMFLDDDIEPPKDIIPRLLEHDKDIVTGLYLMRNFPHQPIIFADTKDDGRCLHKFLQPGERGLVPIVNCGLGAALIKIEVFKTMPQPWITLGEAEPDHWCDDISFFNRARKLGFELFCDLDVHVGHMCSLVVKPHYENDQWYIAYDTRGSSKVLVPNPSPVFVQERVI
jgi:GT2 family glycosyltransferase